MKIIITSAKSAEKFIDKQSNQENNMIYNNAVGL